jgi:PAS domain-containing protein
MPIGPPKFEDLLEAAPDAMVGTDASGVAVFANGRARTLLGRDPVGEPLG